MPDYSSPSRCDRSIRDLKEAVDKIVEHEPQDYRIFDGVERILLMIESNWSVLSLDDLDDFEHMIYERAADKRNKTSEKKDD